LKESQILPNSINNFIYLPLEKYAKKSLEYVLTFYGSIDANGCLTAMSRVFIRCPNTGFLKDELLAYVVIG
jgi:hypothetical protein